MQHALQIRQAIQLDNYHKFFQLYPLTPNLGSYILDSMLAGVRLKALQRMHKTYKLNVAVAFILQEIGFAAQYEDQLIGIDFMKQLGCVIKDAEGNTLEGEKLCGKDEVNALIWNMKETALDTSAIYNNENLLL